MDFDNAGLQTGRLSASLNRAVLALDITEAVIDEAAAEKAELIISHHPLIWGTLKSVSGRRGEKLLRLAENGIAAISMHTNLDIAAGGVNDVLLGLFCAEAQGPLDNLGCGRLGNLEETMELSAFLALVREKLGGTGLRYYSAGRPVHRLAVMGGAGGDALEAAAERGCDTYLTADIKYDQFLLAAELGINLIDGDHFCTENPVIPVLAEALAKRFPDTEFIVSKKHQQLISFA